MEEQMTNLKCRKCGAPVTADQKKCSKCGAPVFLKIMMEEEKRHLPAKEIREKDRRMRQEYKKLSEKKDKQLQKEEKKKEKELLKAERASASIQEPEITENQVDFAEQADFEEDMPEKKSHSALITFIVLLVIIIAVAAVMLLLPGKNGQDTDNTVPTITPTQSEEVSEPAAEPQEEPEEEPQEEEPQEEQHQEEAQEEEKPQEEKPQEEKPQEEKPQEEPAPAPEPEPEPESKPKETPKPANTAKNNDYLFPSDTQKLTESDVAGLSKSDVGLIRNEIYARKGYIFKSEPYKSYFNSQEWYHPTTSSSNLPLNATEKYNVEFLLEYERSQGWR